MDQQTLEQKETYDLPFLPVIVHDALFSPESNPHRLPDPDLPQRDRGREPDQLRQRARATDPRVPRHRRPLPSPGQSEALYEALQAAGVEASFTLVDSAGHSVDDIIGAESFTVRNVNPGGQERVDQKPAPTWDTVEQFLHVAPSRARH